MALLPKTGHDERVKTKQAEYTFDAPTAPGIYAWYLVPSPHSRENRQRVVNCLCTGPSRVSTTVRMDYGLSLFAETTAVPQYSRANSDTEIISSTFTIFGASLHSALETFFSPYFARPIYIGMASNLKRRLFDEHVKSMFEYWLPDHPVSKYIMTNSAGDPRSLIDQIARDLALEHSFALEARVRGFAPSELRVWYVETSEFEGTGASDIVARRSLERLLQMICLPVCGRI